MSRPFPYTYISCPCTDTPTPVRLPGRHNVDGVAGKLAKTPLGTGDEAEEEERTFDPRSPRSNYSLYPLEHLLYCEDCHQIRCPRCVLDEIVCWFCPNCLFEVPSSMVKTEGNRYVIPRLFLDNSSTLFYWFVVDFLPRRCTRNCYSCPICTTPLAVTAMAVDRSSRDDHYVLYCSYCSWSTSDIGILFDRPGNITAQLERVANGGGPASAEERAAARQKLIASGKPSETIALSDELTPDERFKKLKSFYVAQLIDSSSSSASPDLSSAYGYGSPGALSRIMGLYSGVTGYGNKKTKTKSAPMREASTQNEGLKLLGREENIIEKMKRVQWDNSECTCSVSLERLY
jgi:dynactin-4